MTQRRRAGLLALAVALVAGGVLVGARQEARGADPPAAATPKPALSVTLTQPQPTVLVRRIAANGNIAAWQEASVGTEANGLRLAEVLVNVGDVVRRGQVLATFAADTTLADVAQIRAAVAEAEANAADAAANAQRARDLQSSGALSESVINQYLTAERTARARLEAQRAAAQTQQLRLRQTRVLAPDSGVISARSATVGAVLPAGQELFRLIRQSRLEWRAEVAASELALLKPGTRVSVTPAGGAPIAGKVRMVAPTVDPATRNGLVYVDLPAAGAARAGMFARGEFEIGSSSALTLPQSAVQMREGFTYVWQVDPSSKARQTKIGVGRRAGDRIEVTGLPANARVVVSGGGFLSEGDTVRVVEAAAPPAGAASRSTGALPGRAGAMSGRAGAVSGSAGAMSGNAGALPGSAGAMSGTAGTMSGTSGRTVPSATAPKGVTAAAAPTVGARSVAPGGAAAPGSGAASGAGAAPGGAGGPAAPATQLLPGLRPAAPATRPEGTAR